ncbi:MAG: flagellar filament outer layer protein FlaA [Spirochaetaceae bacterium]|jgi:hypothetical protein|nr:flagellar filament outer layer protein FlaA [Spirochaetaceae bacterium]
MKRMFILVAIALFIVGSLFAEEAILIDFSKLTADIVANQDNQPTQNRATAMDYANVAGGSFTTEQKTVMKTSLAITNWDVVLASSSRTVGNQVNSYTLEAPSKQWGTVMGVRIHFPVENWNSWAIIKPPFDIPAFEPRAEVDDDGNIQEAEGDGITGPSRFEEGYGVVKNVGTIKSIAVNAYGLNFPHSLSAILIDAQGNSQTVFMGYLNYDGWGELRWDNPGYITEVRNRELRLYPLYPQSTPFVKFGGFFIQRDGAKDGGDFIGYFKDVKIIYDKAVLDTERDIDDESLWNIIKERETAKKVWEMERFGHEQVLRYLESQKQATENTFTPTPTNNE